VRREVVERPIELAPEKHRELMLCRRGEVLLPMSPQPALGDKALALLREALAELGMMYAPGDSEADLLDTAFREGGLLDWRCPWGRPGGLLWCREPWAQVGHHFRYRNRDAIKGDEIVWLPAERMPREAARLVIEIDDVGISRDDQGRYVWALGVEASQ